MRIRFLKSWRFYRVGQVLDAMPDGMANVLKMRNIVEEVREPKRGRKKKSGNGTRVS